MIDYHSYCQIRHLREQDKLSIMQIAAALSLERSTVRKWLGRAKYERRRSPLPLRRSPWMSGIRFQPTDGIANRRQQTALEA